MEKVKKYTYQTLTLQDKEREDEFLERINQEGEQGYRWVDTIIDDNGDISVKLERTTWQPQAKNYGSSQSGRKVKDMINRFNK